MYKHILIPTDGSDIADKAVAAGIEYARQASARVTLFTAVPENEPTGDSDTVSRRPISAEEHVRRSEGRAATILAGSVKRAKESGIAFDTAYMQSDHPYQAIIDAARSHGCDAIFMASHGRKKLAALWHGSQTMKVLSHSDIPTLVYR